MKTDRAAGVAVSFAARLTRYRTYAVSVLAATGPAVVFAVGRSTASSGIAAMALVAASTFLLPRQSQQSIALENRINLSCGLLLPGRLSRCLVAIPSVLMAAVMLKWPTAPDFRYLVLAVMAPVGISATAATLAFRGMGDRITNAVLGYAGIFWIMTAENVPSSHVVGLLALYLCAAAFILDLMYGAFSDFRARHPRCGGIGVFFGTFNPVHRTHIEIIRRAIADRGLDVVYVHPTTVPKLHRDALDRGEIEFDHRDGMRVYRKTDRADPNKNYFPTGNMFFEYDVRNELLKSSIRDDGLEDLVKVLELPRLYETEGFLGIARRIRRDHPDRPIHGLHGSDPGGMWVRNLFEACGGITPCPVVRRDEVSATAIRKGAVGMTTPTVERFLSAVRSARGFAFPSGFVFEPIAATTHGSAQSKMPRDADRHIGDVEAAR